MTVTHVLLLMLLWDLITEVFLTARLLTTVKYI